MEKSDESPKWLKKIQENSWEAEILISGGAIFSLIQLVDSISSFSVYLKQVTGFTGLNEILIFLHLGFNGIIIGFFLHLIFRSFWIALVCLRYAFPEGINIANLKVQGSYLKEAQSFDFSNQIVKLNRLSGLLFFGSLAFILVISGLILSTVVALFICQVATYAIDLSITQGVGIFASFFFIFFLDLIGGGLLRRTQIMSTLFKPFYVFLNVVSLAFIYRPWFQVLSSNISKWKLFLTASIFALASLGLTSLTLVDPLSLRSVLDSRRYTYDDLGVKLWLDGFYENRISQEALISYACIHTDIVSDNYLRIFIPYKKRYDVLIDGVGGRGFQDIVILRVDGLPFECADWIFGWHSSRQEGITSYLPVDGLSKGKHELTIEMINGKWPFPLIIPFWK